MWNKFIDKADRITAIMVIPVIFVVYMTIWKCYLAWEDRQLQKKENARNFWLHRGPYAFHTNPKPQTPKEPIEEANWVHEGF